MVNVQPAGHVTSQRCLQQQPTAHQRRLCPAQVWPPMLLQCAAQLAALLLKALHLRTAGLPANAPLVGSGASHYVQACQQKGLEAGHITSFTMLVVGCAKAAEQQ